MATFDTLHTVVAGPSAANRFFAAYTGLAAPRAGGVSAARRLRAAIAGLTAALIAWNDGRISRKALAKLTDHELSDLGLTRADIAVMSRRQPRR